MSRQSYYQPQENGEYIYIEVDNENLWSKPLVWPEYYDTFQQIEDRHAKSGISTPIQIIPYEQQLS